MHKFIAMDYVIYTSMYRSAGENMKPELLYCAECGCHVPRKDAQDIIGLTVCPDCIHCPECQYKDDCDPLNCPAILNKKVQHGGPRPNAGRKPAPYPTQLLKIQATKEELEQILQLTTRERAEALLLTSRIITNDAQCSEL